MISIVRSLGAVLGASLMELDLGWADRLRSAANSYRSAADRSIKSVGGLGINTNPIGSYLANQGNRASTLATRVKAQSRGDIADVQQAKTMGKVYKDRKTQMLNTKYSKVK